MWSLSWIFGASYDGRYLRTKLMKIQRLGFFYLIRLITSRGGLGGYELVTAPKYCGNGLLTRINGEGSSSPTRIRYAPDEAAIEKKQGIIAYALRDSSYVLSFIKIVDQLFTIFILCIMS